MDGSRSRGYRRKRSTMQPDIKLAVFGAPSVGKSALTLRRLTKHYIGEVDPNQDCRYQNELVVDGETLVFDIMDVCPQNINDLPNADILRWADCIVLVYSITDRLSFNYIRLMHQRLNFEVPITLLGNKADMVHLRQVSTEEGEILAKDFECSFAEVAAAEQVDEVVQAFNNVAREVLNNRRKAMKHSLLDRMLGNRSHRVYSRGKSDSALPKE